jgi:uncharacterized membrane protein YeaQ/YmgE (transglycosylase-associated protein family)
VYPIREGKEEYMYLLAWIFIGVLVGWGSGRILVGNNSYGLFMDVAMGIAGAVAAGLDALRWLSGLWGHDRYNRGCRDRRSTSADSCRPRERPKNLRRLVLGAKQDAALV